MRASEVVERDSRTRSTRDGHGGREQARSRPVSFRGRAFAPKIASFLVASVAAFGAAAVFAGDAHASGLYFSDRGVRPMGRAGAFVAGADDLGAIWYNPAGVADAGSAVLMDFGWLHFSNEYQRELRIVDADNTVRYVHSPNIKGTSPVLPIPTIAMSLVFGEKKEWTVAGGFIAPQVALASYPEFTDGQPSPARYTLGSFSGSLLGIPGAWIAYKPHPKLRLGVGLQALVGWFQTTVTFSASPQDRLLGAPEQPEYDAQSQMRVGLIIAPSANGGVIYEPDPHVRFGLALQAPMIVNSPATLKVRLPTSAAFDTANISGDRANVRFVLPAILRLGVEVRPVPALRVEVAYVREFWSAHKSIEVTPRDITMNGIVGAPPSVALPIITIPRGFIDSNSFRLGGEYALKLGEYTLDLRAGVSYETSAVPPAYLSLSSLDFDKALVSLGGSIHIGQHWRLDGTFAHLFATTTTVTPEEAQIPRINPLKGNAPLEAVNGGTYSAAADLIGVGLNYTF